MPQQLIYTSAPQGIVAGRSGHCTVARSAKMREPLMLQLEKFCYYQHLSLTGGQERPIYSCRIVDIRGTRFHVLSRIQDAGLDFTGRTNFIAHHLVFTPEEIRQFPTPPVILREWPGWVKSWTKDPQMLENENWADLAALAGRSNVPAQTWQRVTGDAVNGYGLLEARAGASFRVDDQADETVLEVIAESLELLEVRDTRRDFRTSAWNYTFTTSIQEQDNPADFRWRCIHSDNPAASRFATPDCRALSAVRATKLTGEESNFARAGRQPPSFVRLTADKYDIQEGSSVKLEVATDGSPTPTIRWFEIERNQPKELVGTSGTIQILNPEGRSKRYQVQAFNSAGSIDSSVVEISIRAPVKIPTLQQQTASVAKPKPVVSIDENPYETLNQKYENENAKQARKFPILQLLAVLVLLSAIGAVVYFEVKHKKANAQPAPASPTNNVPVQTPPQVLPDQTNSGTAKAVSPRQPLVQDDLEKLPPPWTKKTIGGADTKSSVFLDGHTFVIKGYGKKIYKNSDSFFFVNQSVSNSLEFVVRLSSTNNEEAGRRGIMMRESEKADAPFAFIGLSQKQISWMQRTSSGTDCSPPVTCPAPQLPYYFRISRQAKSFTGAFSADNKKWTVMGTNEIDMPDQNYLVGFAVCSTNNNNVAVRAEFDTVTVTPAKQ